VINKIYDYAGLTMFYTYLLKCVPTNEFYYGVRYSKNSSPKEFWKTYFTSSKVVKERVKMFGKEAFVYEVRKVFSCSKRARKWEDTVIRRLKLVERNNFLNKSRGICFDARASNFGKKMVMFLATGEYKMVEPKLAEYLEEHDIAILQGIEKPAGFGENISRKMKGHVKTSNHLNSISSSLKGKKRGTLEERYGPSRAAEISNKISSSLVLYCEENPNHLKNKTYEEAYGVDKAADIKAKRSTFFQKNNPGKSMKGKSYEELYGVEKAEELKRNRAATGKGNRKVYIISHNGEEVFKGDRLEAENFLVSNFQLPRSNVLYHKDFLSSKDITVQTLRARR
jgi:hypothetical protein